MLLAQAQQTSTTHGTCTITSRLCGPTAKLASISIRTASNVQTSDQEDCHEVKIELPTGWLNGFMQLQAAMGLPMRKVTLGVDTVYSLLAFLKRHKAKTSPRAIRFELTDRKPPALVLEPWEQTARIACEFLFGSNRRTSPDLGTAPTAVAGQSPPACRFR